jgi:hypothetical protein
MAQWGFLRSGMALLIVCALLLSSAGVATASSPSQDAEPQPLLLGEMGTAVLAAGESVSFAFEAPDETTYVIASGDEAEAAKFTLVVTDDNGNEAYNGPFDTVELELDNGDSIVTATANEDGVLSLFVTGQIGEFSEDYGEGEMMNGSFVVEEDVDNTLYATIEIDDTDSWQRAFVVLVGGEDDTYSANVSGDAIYESIMDSSAEGPLNFWTQGGDYVLDITPIEGGDSLTAIVMLSGPIPALTLGEERVETMSPDSKEKAFRFTAGEVGREYTVSLVSENEDVDIDLAVSADPTTDTWSSYNSGTDESVTFVAPIAGDYFIKAYTSSDFDEPVEFTALVEEGDLAPALEPNSATWDEVEAGENRIYTLQLDEGNQFVTLFLVANPEVDLDMTAQQVGESGSSTISLSSYNTGSNEVLSALATEPGVLQVTVSGEYASDDTPFVLLARVESPGAVAGQWATAASASSQYGEDGYSAAQATGPANVAAASDNPLAWTSKDSDGTVETLELTYDYPVVPTGIAIYENFNPGAVAKIEALDVDSEEWVVLWEGSEPAEDAIRVFRPRLDEAEFLTNQIRLTLDSDLVAGWNEIDAVQLYGQP